jgi:hypothetical protein
MAIKCMGVVLVDLQMLQINCEIRIGGGGKRNETRLPNLVCLWKWKQSEGHRTRFLSLL